jgi:LmbE family N-acetylglucosaminyl deacetylase
MSGSRVLVLVPHPDDEVVGCAAAIGRARARGARFQALYLTTGVPPPDAVWPWQRARYPARVERRRREALQAAARLGIEPLAFCPWPARTLRDHLPEARRAIAYLARREQFDAVWAPAYEGGHQDHDVASFLASTVAHQVLVLEFSEYNAARGAQQFPAATGEETVLELTSVEAAAKAETLAVYRSERANLRRVRCAREVLRPQARYDYRHPPHRPPLFYERFQWIPLRHPRVDFTSPREVCATLARFLPAAPAEEGSP